VGQCGVMAAVTFAEVSYSVGGKLVLDRLSFAVESGETLVLLGRSGSGKSTALRLTNGLLRPSSGAVLVDGRETREWDLVRLRRGIGYVIQDVGLFPHFTVARNVGLVPRLEGWPENKVTARVDEVLELVGLDPSEYRGRYPGQLSGGQRQRVGVARALAADPPLLLFDEPFGALDPVTRWELQQQFLALRKRLGKTAIFVTHDIREAMLLGSRVAVLAHGSLEVITTAAAFPAAQTAEARAFLECL
jgi:osmoprotectant transport system ATP-binding protein